MGRPSPVRVELMGHQFLMSPRAYSGYAFSLENDDLSLSIDDRPVDVGPAVYARLRSHFLWREGHRSALDSVRSFVRNLAEHHLVSREIVSRVDLAVDFQGWVPREEDFDRFCTRARHRVIHKDNGHFSGFTFGKHPLRAILYDKTLEVQASHKEWMHEVWSQAPSYDPHPPLWRLEFQFGRAFLRSHDIHSSSDLLDRLPALFKKGISWLSLRDPTGDRNRSRWPVAGEWRALMSADFGSSSTPLVRRTRTVRSISQLIPQFTGLFADLGAQLDVPPEPSAILARIQPLMDEYLEKKGTCLPDLVATKRARHATLTGNPIARLFRTPSRMKKCRKGGIGLRSRFRKRMKETNHVKDAKERQELVQT